jgi:hypothetical protein
LWSGDIIEPLYIQNLSNRAILHLRKGVCNKCKLFKFILIKENRVASPRYFSILGQKQNRTVYFGWMYLSMVNKNKTQNTITTVGTYIQGRVIEVH